MAPTIMHRNSRKRRPVVPPHPIGFFSTFCHEYVAMSPSVYWQYVTLCLPFYSPPPYLFHQNEQPKTGKEIFSLASL
ncbi:hypothetical protein CW304_20905 [Bacillus sp. UFRGS-B20]|nr:hypothetical protein CW304_20905 [Bacillus sp. UFRGS-B20]